MVDMDKQEEISKLHESIYEQSLVFLALRTRPGCEVKLAETRDRIMQIYRMIQTLI
jgi:hypothetical protein